MINRIFTNKRHEEREKKFWKLKQLDRIEYMLTINSIKDYFSSSSLLIVNFIFLFNIILFLFATLFLIAFKSVGLIQIVPVVFYWSILIIIGSVSYDIIMYVLKSRAIFELRKRFNLN